MLIFLASVPAFGQWGVVNSGNAPASRFIESQHRHLTAQEEEGSTRGTRGSGRVVAPYPAHSKTLFPEDSGNSSSFDPLAR
jgi:hypothetical protein